MFPVLHQNGVYSDRSNTVACLLCIAVVIHTAILLVCMYVCACLCNFLMDIFETNESKVIKGKYRKVCNKEARYLEFLAGADKGRQDGRGM